MTFEESNAKILDEYIANNPQATLQKTHSVVLSGRSVDLQVYKIPLEYLVYNIRNGRFAAEYQELKNKKGRENSEEVTVFDSTGLGVQDLAISNYVYEKYCKVNKIN